MANKLIEIVDLRKQFGSDEVITKVLHGVSFTVNEGEYMAIMGPSGSGKSTLMHIIGFLDRLTTGSYFYNGLDVTKFSDNKLASIRNSEVGFVFQQFNLLSNTTVFDNVKLPLLYSEKKNKDELVKRAIAAVDLEHRTNYISNKLSGGEKQRVAIARAIVNQPKIIFADEPTGNLDSKAGTKIMEIFEALHHEGKTIMLVTHEQDTANHAERILSIRDGLIASDIKVEKRRLASEAVLQK
ncbi:MAG: ABC transporter ATP-binding protein [Candidatus Komeilibacteria bacterium]